MPCCVAGLERDNSLANPKFSIMLVFFIQLTTFAFLTSNIFMLNDGLLVWFLLLFRSRHKLGKSVSTTPNCSQRVESSRRKSEFPFSHDRRFGYYCYCSFARRRCVDWEETTQQMCLTLTIDRECTHVCVCMCVSVCAVTNSGRRRTRRKTSVFLGPFFTSHSRVANSLKTPQGA